MALPDVLTITRALAVMPVVLLYAAHFDGHDYWATGLFCLAMSTDWLDGRIARSRGRTSELGSLLDPVADKLLVSGLRLAALERGVVLHARDLGKLKTWSQAVAAAIAGFAAAGAWRDEIAWWALLVALVLTWVSGLDYARTAPRLWRSGVTA